jgi:hypothetical protein
MGIVSNDIVAAGSKWAGLLVTKHALRPSKPLRQGVALNICAWERASCFN